jgi:type I restriction enzyme S subunit
VAKGTSGTTPSRSNRAYHGGDIPWVKTGELRDKDIDKAEEYITRLALEECSLSLLPPGTLLIAMYGQGQTRGRTGLLRIHATTNQACFAILPNDTEFVPSYLQAWFRHNYQRIRTETENRGGNQPNLNGQILQDMIVPLPPLSEQQRIVSVLENQMAVAEKARAAAEEELNTINALPAALLRRAFNGDL